MMSPEGKEAHEWEGTYGRGEGKKGRMLASTDFEMCSWYLCYSGSPEASADFNVLIGATGMSLLPEVRETTPFGR